jgi:tetratricopeptide (TPR) repeat protein
MAEAGSESDSSLGDLREAIAALEKAARLLAGRPSKTQTMDVQWRLARACFYASELEKEAAIRLNWIAKGEDAGQTAVRERPDRVEGYYYLAVLKGRRAEISGLGFSAMILARKVEHLGEKAVDIDPNFEDGAPYRLLAMLYANAPPWPTSIGDMDKAIEFAQKAIDLSDYPMNHLIMAEVLIEDDEIQDARDELKKVLEAPKVGRWANAGERWRPHARRLLSKIQE